MQQYTTENLLDPQNESLEVNDHQIQSFEMLSQKPQASSIIEDKKQIDSKLERDFLEAIKLIENQSSQINGPLDEEIIFLLGNTGCGKSTLFNWLMGNELIVKKDVNLKAANWIVEAEIENNISKIGHVQISTTSIPKIQKSKYGPYLVDFPGWQDTRGWQYDFVNQFVAAHLTTNCNKIKILFICDYNVFKTDRGNGIKLLVNNINSFAQGNSVHQSAMLVITKLILEDEQDNYKLDIRDHCGEIINNDQHQLCDENKTIISSLISNDIFIMEKASRIKCKYTEDERQLLWKMIRNLKSSSIQLKVYISNQINQEFTKYFNNEMIKKKQRINSIINSISQIQIQIIEKKDKNQILKMHKIVSDVKSSIFQLNLNQIQKFKRIENLYMEISQLADVKELQQIHEINNFTEIYDRFFPLKEQILAYSIEFISNDDLNSLSLIENNLEVELKRIDMINEEQIAQKEKESQRLKEKDQKQMELILQMQSTKKKEYNRMRLHIENQKRGWWFWQKPKIPTWVEDVDEFIRIEQG